MQEPEERGNQGTEGPPSGRKPSELHLVPHDTAARGDSYRQPREGAPALRVPANPDPLAIPVDRVELETLREMLREQQHATLRAIQTAADLQSKLSTAESEVVKVTQQFQGLSKQAGSNNARKADEIAKLQSQWHDTQRELETQRRERRIEAVRQAAKVSTLQRELEARPVPPPLDAPAGTQEKSRRVRGILIAIAGVAAFTALGLTVWRPASRSGPQVEASPAATETVSDTGARFTSRTSNVDDAALPAESPAAFSMAVNRLDDALASFPGRTPEEILQQVSKTKKACRLEWNGGHPSLLFDGEPSHSNSISATIDQCADAVKHLR
jgi:hypothetical protein